MNVRVPVRQTERERERIAAKNMRSNDRFLNYAHRSIILSVRDNAGFGAERMARMVDGAYWIGRGYIDKYSPMAKTDDEYAIDSYYAMRLELEYIGYDPSVELWPDVPFTIADMDLHERQSASMRAENAFYLEFAKKMSFTSERWRRWWRFTSIRRTDSVRQGSGGAWGSFATSG